MAASSNMNSFNQYDNSVAEFWKRASLSLHSACVHRLRLRLRLRLRVGLRGNAHYPARAVPAERIMRDRDQHDTLKKMLNTDYDASSRASSSSTVTGTRVRERATVDACAGS